MAKKKADEQPIYDVYEQLDGALVVLPSDEVPEDDSEPVWSGHAENERDAVTQARNSNKRLRKAPAANSDYEPNMPATVHDDAEAATNERLGIKKNAAKKSARKSASSKTTKSTKSKLVARKAVAAPKKSARRK